MAKKASICVVDVTGGGQHHVKKITVEMDPAEALRMVEELFAGHVVTRTGRGKKTPICAEEPRSEPVKGLGEE